MTNNTRDSAGLNGASAALDALNSAMGAAGERSYEMFQAGIEAWIAETRRFQDEMFVQGSAALDQLKACRSPMDVLAAEQAWLSARSKAYLDAGPRFARAFAAVAQGLQRVPEKPSAPAAPVQHDAQKRREASA